MKKLFVCIIFIITVFSTFAYAYDINIIVNDKILYPDTGPVNRDDRVLVPMRAIFEALGASIYWDQENYSVTAVSGTNAIRVKIDSKTVEYGIINSDGMPVFTVKRDTDVAPAIINDRTYVPVRAVSESIGADVSWHDISRTVIVNSRHQSHNHIFYSSVCDYNKVYKVDTNGAVRTKLSDTPAKEVYYDNGYVYFLSLDDALYRIRADGSGEVKLTDCKTEVIKIENGVVYCLEYADAHKGNMHIIDGNDTDIGYAMYPVVNGGYIYYNVPDSASMRAYNIKTADISDVTMYAGRTLYTYNCVFYGNLILVEDGEYFNNIFAFDADGSNKRAINKSVSRICKNQQYDDNIIYINGDNGQDIYCVKEDGSDDSEIIKMPADTIFVDVLLQNGNDIYYKNMYRKEIYRINLLEKNPVYAGYGDTLKISGDKLFIVYDGLYISDLYGKNQKQIYGKVSDFFAYAGSVYAKDASYNNIVKVGYEGDYINLTNDMVCSWAADMENR